MYNIILQWEVELNTEVVMCRELLGGTVRQKSKSEFLSASDLSKIGNEWRIKSGKPLFSIHEYFRNKSNIEFMEELSNRFGEIKISNRGRNGEVWVHPYLFIDMALAISPTLKVSAYSWIHDHLLSYRNDSGDSYKKMCGGLYAIASNKSLFQRNIVDTCKKIREACGVSDWNSATESQLKMRDKIHEYIFVLTDVVNNYDLAVETGIRKATADMGCNN